MPNMISTGGISTCGGFFEDLGTTIINAGMSYLQTQQAIEQARMTNKINAEQAAILMRQAEAQKATADAEFKKKLPLYIGGGVAVLALLFFVMRRK